RTRTTPMSASGWPHFFRTIRADRPSWAAKEAEQRVDHNEAGHDQEAADPQPEGDAVAEETARPRGGFRRGLRLGLRRRHDGRGLRLAGSVRGGHRGLQHRDRERVDAGIARAMPAGTEAAIPRPEGARAASGLE